MHDARCLLIFVGGLLVGDAVGSPAEPVFFKHRALEQVPGNDTGREADGEKLLLHSQRGSSQRSADEHNGHNLHDHSDEGDSNEPHVIEKSSEHVLLTLDLASVELVEDLEVDEKVEDHSVHDDLLCFFSQTDAAIDDVAVVIIRGFLHRVIRACPIDRVFASGVTGFSLGPVEGIFVLEFELEDVFSGE